MKPRYYPFLDVVLDVFYSIILYNVFVAYPGWRLESFLMLFASFLMLNYWWEARSDITFPKYYLIDFYFISLIMFIFSLWPSHFLNLSFFLTVTTAFFLIDALYTLIIIYAHKETTDRPSLKVDVAVQLLLAVIYFIYSQIFTVLTVEVIIYIFSPYLIWYVINIRRGYFKTKFIDSGHQPY